MHFFQQLDKPRIGTKRVEDPVDFEELGQPLRANLVGVLQPVQGPLFITETEIDNGCAERRDESARRHLIQLRNHGLGLGALPGRGIGVAEPSSGKGRMSR